MSCPVYPPQWPGFCEALLQESFEALLFSFLLLGGAGPVLRIKLRAGVLAVGGTLGYRGLVGRGDALNAGFFPRGRLRCEAVRGNASPRSGNFLLVLFLCRGCGYIFIHSGA